MALRRSASKHLTIGIPVDLVPVLERFTKEHGFDSLRAACFALLEAGLTNYPRWGVRKGIVRAIRNDARQYFISEMMAALRGVDERITDAMSTPTEDEMAEGFEEET